MNAPRATTDVHQVSGSADRTPVDHERVLEHQRELELELTRIRNEASAARLQARAAELELMIRRLTQTGISNAPPSGEPLSLAGEHASWEGPAAPSGAFHTHSPIHFQDWEQVRATLASPIVGSEVRAGHGAVAGSADGRTGRGDEDLGPGVNPSPETNAPNAELRRTQGLEPDAATEPASVTEQASATEPAREFEAAVGSEPVSELEGAIEPISSGMGAGASEERRDETADVAPVSLETSEPRRKRPAALLISTAAHVALFAVLAAVSLSGQRPKDQVALSAAVNEPEQTPIKTFSIETVEPEVEPKPPTPQQAPYELTPVGELAATDLSLEAPSAGTAIDADTLFDSGSDLSSTTSLKQNAGAQTQFCGVKGGGNHFVYLVDSSGSMRGAFASARRELLRSIDQLESHQRFYVIFFDAEPDSMRLSSPERDEPRSVLATPENKRRLRQWALQISINRGRAPYEPLRFALELRPDVIFLLSDGEFPQGIEELLQEQNREDNLFGDRGPISIVHTIGYHNREGETRMRRIATQNGGQYRHVPAR